MRISVTFPEIRTLLEAARHIPGISPDLARAISCCFCDLAPAEPVKTSFSSRTKQLASAANKMALVGPESSEDFGVLSVRQAHAPLLADALRSHFGPSLPDVAAALLSRLEQASQVVAIEQKKGRGRPRSDFEEVESKVTFAAPELTPTEVAAQPVRPPLPPGLDVGWLVSETELLAAYQLLRGVGL
jgi:hypothetical protein